MKRFIKSSQTAEGVNRIEIDFYGVDLEEEIEAARSNPRKVFKNADVVIRDVKAYLEDKGLKILRTSRSNHKNSDSTYYDVDIKVTNNKGKYEFIYLRISDHPESSLNDLPRKNYHDRITRSYKGLKDTDNVDGLYHYASIEVTGKQFNNYDRAMNRVKERIDEILKGVGLE